MMIVPVVSCGRSPQNHSGGREENGQEAIRDAYPDKNGLTEAQPVLGQFAEVRYPRAEDCRSGEPYTRESGGHGCNVGSGQDRTAADEKQEDDSMIEK